MMKRVLRKCFAVVLLASSSARALPILDQSQELLQQIGSAAAFGRDAGELGQTFTAGLTGLLGDVQIGNTSGTGMVFPPNVAPIVQIRDTVAGQPGPTVLGSVTLPSPIPFTDWTPLIDFLPMNVPITAGQMYSIVILPSDPAGSITVGVRWDPASYADGALWRYSNGAWQVESFVGGGDMQFRTYVETGSAIPAPGALLLGSLGTGLIAWLRRRRTL